MKATTLAYFMSLLFFLTLCLYSLRLSLSVFVSQINLHNPFLSIDLYKYWFPNLENALQE